MDRRLLAVGGTVILAGGLIYWYLSQNGNGNGVIKCSDYTSQGTCEANDCYWCDDKCQSTPCDTEFCGALGSCYPGINGIQKCNYLNNLCKCDGNNWNLVEENSSICKNNISHGTCAVNQDNIVFCAENFGHGTDECEIGYIGTGCPCDIGECQSSAACIEDFCIRKAAASTISQNCEGLQHECQKTLDEPLAVQYITGGSIFYKWAGIIDNVNYIVDYYFRGFWYRVYENTIPTSGTEGVLTIPSIYHPVPMGVEKIRMGVASNISNIHIKSWSITLGW